MKDYKKVVENYKKAGSLLEETAWNYIVDKKEVNLRRLYHSIYGLPKFWIQGEEMFVTRVYYNENEDNVYVSLVDCVGKKRTDTLKLYNIGARDYSSIWLNVLMLAEEDRRNKNK